MYNKEQLNDLYEQIVKNIDISNELFDSAEVEYTALGAWLDKETPTYKIDIYPQGSFALGTVIKPIRGTDDYDLDLVCEFAHQYELSAEELKCSVVKPLLQKYHQINGEIEEKRRCWHVEYTDTPNFHMDVIPAICCNKFINITDLNEENGNYVYIGSNPKGYVDWFHRQMKKRQQSLREQYYNTHRDVIKCQADVETLKEYHFKTPLQKAIQILKRYRDIKFDEDKNHIKPISIIITTIAAQLYNNEDNIVDTLTTILNKAEQYIRSHMNGREYHIDNPSYTGGNVENFADKWNEHPERAITFFNWLKDAKNDLVDSMLLSKNDSERSILLENNLGKHAINNMFQQNKTAASQEMKMAILQNKQIILNAPHRKKLPYALPHGYGVIINATVTTKDNNKYNYPENEGLIPKNSSIEFRALFSNIRKPFCIKWQVVNTGDEATRAQCLRGGFDNENNKTTRVETTAYSGHHSIQCFIIKDNRCVAQSDIFIVNIE